MDYWRGIPCVYGRFIKENVLLNPMDYSEDQKCLVEDFNRRIKDITGIVTGIDIIPSNGICARRS